uniref:Putative lipocalin n=1 Tax=Ixodes ricinus TaxID=34613 RepID=A0A6B0V122_IXORI
MTILFYLGMLLVCPSHAILSKHCQRKTEEDCPDANKVMVSINRTYMFQSLENIPTLECEYQSFYDFNNTRFALKPKYDKVPVTKNRGPLVNRFYVWNVVSSTIHLSRRYDWQKEPTQLEILYSDFESCMVTKGPQIEAFPYACRLWVTESAFAKPPLRCTEGFKRHCTSTAFTYSMTGCVKLYKPH